MTDSKITLNIDELRDLCTEAMFRALALRAREDAIARNLYRAEGMREQIRAAEAGETKGKHSMFAEFVVTSYEAEISPPGARFEFLRQPPPAPFLHILEEARRHLQVDLSEFRPAPRAPRTSSRS